MYKRSKLPTLHGLTLATLIPWMLLVLFIQHELTQAVSSLPQLPDNKLAEGNNRFLPNGAIIDCGSERMDASRIRTLSLRDALTTDNFKTRGFTSGIISSPGAATITEPEARFKVVEIKARRILYALQVDASGEKAYWLKQGVHLEEPYPFLDIPQHPNADQPQYVFTSDFSGCSWTVTPLNNGYLRLRHVSGGHEARQFNNLTPDEKGGSVSYAMQYKDYGYTVETKRLADTIHAFVYMHYSDGHWTLHLQRKICAPALGVRQFTNKVLTSVSLRDTLNTIYSEKPITSTKDFRIP